MNPQTNAAISKLGKLSTQLTEQFEVVKKYTYDKLEVVMSDIEAKQDELKQLDATFKEKYREASVDLKLRMKEDAQREVTTYATLNKMVLVPKEELDDLYLKADMKDNDVKKQIAAAVGAAENRAKAEFKSKSVDTTIKIAQLESQLTQSNEQNQFLKAEIERLTAENKAAGQRIVEVAQANSSVVNVSGK